MQNSRSPVCPASFSKASPKNRPTIRPFQAFSLNLPVHRFGRKILTERQGMPIINSHSISVVSCQENPSPFPFFIVLHHQGADLSNGKKSFTITKALHTPTESNCRRACHLKNKKHHEDLFYMRSSVSRRPEGMPRVWRTSP